MIAEMLAMATNLVILSGSEGSLPRAREKQINGRLRSRKIASSEPLKPGWGDLSDGWYDV